MIPYGEPRIWPERVPLGEAQPFTHSYGASYLTHPQDTQQAPHRLGAVNTLSDELVGFLRQMLG